MTTKLKNRAVAYYLGRMRKWGVKCSICEVEGAKNVVRCAYLIAGRPIGIDLCHKHARQAEQAGHQLMAEVFTTHAPKVGNNVSTKVRQAQREEVESRANLPKLAPIGRGQFNRSF